jgi:integrase
MATWTEGQAAAFLASVADDRLCMAWQCSLYGLRRGEVLGLRLSDVDLDAATLTVAVTRIIVDGEVVHSEPKTDRGRRTLPLDVGLVAGLRRLHARQAAERLAAGSAYTIACPDCGQAHLFVDELGETVHPESYSDRFEVLARKAKVPAIRLHDTRHTASTLMHRAIVNTCG